MGVPAVTIDDWRREAPRLAAEVAAEWRLTLGEPYVPGATGHVVRAERDDGAPAVLKLVYPDRETEQEPDALERWDGDGAVRLLARDDERHAMLLERCEPGSFLSAAPDPLGVLVELLPRLWKPAGGFRSLAAEAAHWIEGGDLGAMRPGRLRDAAIAYLRDLAPSQGEQVLVHQDLHGDNVLAAEREPWLVIDPKPLAGEREFALAPIVRSLELGETRRDATYRFDRLTAELGLDRERAPGWTIAHTVAWCGGSDPWWEALAVAEWLLEDAP